MHFNPLTLLVSATVASALTIPTERATSSSKASTTVSFSGTKLADGTLKAGPDTTISKREDELEKRELIVLTILGLIGTAALTEVVAEATAAAIQQVKDIVDWTNAREAFTQATTSAMWAKNPDTNKWPGTVCYNKGYTVGANIDGKASMELKSGLLHTDYDCMYIGKGNTFVTLSDGGFINLSYTHNSLCTYHSDTGDLSC